MKRGALVLLVLLSTYALFAVPVYVRIYPWSNTEREILALEAVLQRYLDPDATAYVTNDDRYIIQWEMGDIDPDDFFCTDFYWSRFGNVGEYSGCKVRLARVYRLYPMYLPHRNRFRRC